MRQKHHDNHIHGEIHAGRHRSKSTLSLTLGKERIKQLWERKISFLIIWKIRLSIVYRAPSMDNNSSVGSMVLFVSRSSCFLFVVSSPKLSSRSFSSLTFVVMSDYDQLELSSVCLRSYGSSTNRRLYQLSNIHRSNSWKVDWEVQLERTKLIDCHSVVCSSEIRLTVS